MDDTTRKFDVERMVRHRSRMASIFELTFYYVVASLIFAKRYYSTGILKPEPAKIFEVLTDPFVLASFGITNNHWLPPLSLIADHVPHTEAHGLRSRT